MAFFYGINVTGFGGKQVMISHAKSYYISFVDLKGQISPRVPVSVAESPWHPVFL
jgi:hypothetical protein